MDDLGLDVSTTSRQRQAGLSRWDYEDADPRDPQIDVPDLTNAELVQLRVRVIALENLVIALLAEGSDRPQAIIREMATYISPRPGFTPHPLTLQAAAHMVQLVNRAVHFQDMPPS
jgi:hypothetical protein